MSNFHPLEVVCRGSDTQLQVGEKLNKVTWKKLMLTTIYVVCVLLKTELGSSKNEITLWSIKAVSHPRT